MAPAISDFEISIIKGMLRMGYTPATIQAYFTRPDRLVNPARIQEIRNGDNQRAKKIKSAADDEVGEFIDGYVVANPNNNMYVPPQQDEAVSQFSLGEGGRLTISVRDQDLKLGDPDIKDIYDELRVKAINFHGIGHNSLAGIYEEIEKFCNVLPENPEEASVVRIFMRGSGLRSKLASYKASSANPDLYPVVELDAAVLPIFEDLMDSFGLLVNLTPSMALLENKAGSTDEYTNQGEVLNTVKPAIEDASEVADASTAEIINDQIDLGITAQSDKYGHAQRSVAFSSVRNFAIAVFSPIYRAARYVLGDDKLPTILKTVRNTVAAKLTTEFYNYVQTNFPLIVQYIHSHADTLLAYAQKIVTNQNLQDFLVYIIEIFKSFM